MTAITQFWRGIFGQPQEAVSRDFDHMLMRELMRIRALIVVALVIMFNIAVVRFFFPAVEERIWKGVNPNAVYLILTGFVLFEIFVHQTIKHHLQLDRDLPVYRRYIGVLIETTIPRLILWLQIESMGQA